MTPNRPDDRTQLEYLIAQGYRLHACCPPEHHEIEIAKNMADPCKETASGKIPYDLDKRCHMGNWRNTPGLTIEQLRRIEGIKPMPNVGMKLDIGIIRLDIDGEVGEARIAEKKLNLPDTWEFTSGRGRGLLYRTPPNVTCDKRTVYEKVEILGDRQQTVLPPSRHRRGTVYQWKEGHAPTEVPLENAPQWILDALDPITREKTKEPARNEDCHFWNLTIEEILGAHPSNFPSPFHDSEGGVNSSIGEGVHHCWRHDVCHSPLQALAVLSGIMGTNGNEACFRAGKGHHGTKESEVEFTRENIEIMWNFAKLDGKLSKEDLHPFEETKIAGMPGYRPPQAYFEITEHPRTNPPKPPTEKFIPGIFIKDVLKNEHFLIRSVEGKKGRLWRYSDGYYHPDGETYLLTLFKKVMEPKYPQTGRLHRLEILDAIRSGCFKDKEQLVDDADVIPVENGVLNWRTKELRPYDRDKDIFFFQLPLSYDPIARSPEIDKFHVDVLPKGGIEAVIDYLACCLYRKPMKSHFIAYGPPHSGKTTETLLFEEFLGPESVSNVKFHRIARDRFASAGLEDKLANIYAEIGRGALRELGQINATTGTDKINLERKGIDSRENFQPYAKHWFCTNDLPRLDVVVDKKNEDITSMDAWEVMAFFERFSLIEYNRVFSDHPRPGSSEKLMDRQILERLKTPSELSGLLNQVLDRMAHVVRNGPRTTMNAKDSMMLYLRDSNPVQAFIVDGGVEFDHDYESIKEATREALQYYCKVNELQTKFSDTVIKNALKIHGVCDYRDEKDVPNRAHWWTGIRLTNEWVPKDEELGAEKKIQELIKNGVRKVADRPKPSQMSINGPTLEQIPPFIGKDSGTISANVSVSPHVPPGSFQEASCSPPGLSDVYALGKEGGGGNIRSITVTMRNPGGDLLANPKQGGGDLGEMKAESSTVELAEDLQKALLDLQSRVSPQSYEHEFLILQSALETAVNNLSSGDRCGAYLLRIDGTRNYPDRADSVARIVDTFYSEIESVAKRIIARKKSLQTGSVGGS